MGRVTMRHAVLLVALLVVGAGCSRPHERQVVARAARALQARDTAALRALAAPGRGDALVAALPRVPADYVAYSSGDPRIEFRGRDGREATYFVPARGRGRCAVGVVFGVVGTDDGVRVRVVELRPDLLVHRDSLAC